MIGSKTRQSETNDYMLAIYRMRAHYEKYPHNRIRGRKGNVRKDVINRIKKSDAWSREDLWTVY